MSGRDERSSTPHRVLVTFYRILLTFVIISHVVSVDERLEEIEHELQRLLPEAVAEDRRRSSSPIPAGCELWATGCDLFPLLLYSTPDPTDPDRFPIGAYVRGPSPIPAGCELWTDGCDLFRRLDGTDGVTHFRTYDACDRPGRSRCERYEDPLRGGAAEEPR